MHALQVALVCCFVVWGLIVMGTYTHLYWAYTHLYSEWEKRKVWALWYHVDTAWILVFSASVSALGFLYFSMYVIVTLDESAPWWGVCAYGLFLFFSSLYGPLLACERAGWAGAKWSVLLALLLVACSAIALCVWTQGQWSWAQAPFLNLSITWLAAHCTVLDLGLWGYAWSHGWMWTTDEDLPLGETVMLVYSVHDENGHGIGQAYENPRLMIGDV